MQKRLAKLFLFSFLLFLCIVSFAFGYIDPGTTGLVLNSVWSYVIGLFGVIAGFVFVKFINPIKKWLKSMRRKKT